MNGYTAVQLGIGHAKVKNVSKAERGRFAVAKVEPKLKLVRNSASSDDALLPRRRRDHGRSFHRRPVRRRDRHLTGKGFAGPMKRWNFGGLRATHGVSFSHRSHGSTGGRQDPGKTFKNKKMAGHLGGRSRDHVEPQGRADSTSSAGLILVEGAVPGTAGGWIYRARRHQEGAAQGLPQPGKFKLERNRWHCDGQAAADKPATHHRSGSRRQSRLRRPESNETRHGPPTTAPTRANGDCGASIDLDDAIFGLECRAPI